MSRFITVILVVCTIASVLAEDVDSKVIDAPKEDAVVKSETKLELSSTPENVKIGRFMRYPDINMGRSAPDNEESDEAKPTGKFFDKLHWNQNKNSNNNKNKDDDDDKYGYDKYDKYSDLLDKLSGYDKYETSNKYSNKYPIIIGVPTPTYGYPHYGGGYNGYPGGYNGYPGGYNGYPGGYNGYPGGYNGYPGGYNGYPGGYNGYPGYNKYPNYNNYPSNNKYDHKYKLRNAHKKSSSVSDV